MSNIADSRPGLCQQCLGHNVAEIEAEKEVDTRSHAEAEENDEKKESFEDLPEHLRLGTEFTLRVTVLQVLVLVLVLQVPPLVYIGNRETWSCKDGNPIEVPGQQDLVERLHYWFAITGSC